MKYKLLLILFSVMSVILSCATGTTLQFSATSVPFEEYPDWWLKQKRSTNKYTYFYIRAEDNSEYSSMLLAYEDLLLQLGATFADEDVSEKHRAELITKQSIEEYSLVVSNLQVYFHSPITYECIMEARVPTYELYEEGSKSFTKMVEDLRKLEDLKEKAKKAYRANEDITALDYYIQAALIAENYPIFNGDNSFEELSSRILRIVNNAYVKIYDANSKTATCVIDLKRRSGIIHPNIVFADVEASVPRQNKTTSVMFYKTDADGTISFFPKVRDVDIQGTISFNIRLPQSLNFFKTKHGLGLVSEINKIHEANTSYFVYNLQSVYNEGGINLTGLFYDSKDYEMDSNEYLSILQRLSLENMIMVNLNEHPVSHEEYVVVNAQEVFDDVRTDTTIKEKYILTVIGNVVDVMVIDQEGQKGVRVMLDVLLGDKLTGDIYYRSEALDGVGFDVDETVAMQKAYNNAINYLERQLQMAFYDYRNKGKR